jgi:hypothetical protein
MALVLADRVKETTTTTGTGTITLAGAVTGFRSFATVGNANTTYYTIAGQGTSEWEVGIGTYTASGTALSRDTVLASSAGAPTKTNFSAGTKDVFVTYPANRSVYSDGTSLISGDGIGTFPSGTAMMFVQTAAPTGWTKSTTHNNKALRVVSGTASSGGTVDFTTAFASKAVSGSVSSTTATNQATTATNIAATPTGTVGSTTLTTAEMPSHSHNASFGNSTGGNNIFNQGRINVAGSIPSGINATGGGGSHNHTFTGNSFNLTQNSHNHTQDSHTHTFTGTAIDLAVQYVDVIIATKD